MLEGGGSLGPSGPADCFSGRSNRAGGAGLVIAMSQLLSAGPEGSPRSALRYLLGAEAPCSSWQDCTQRAICSITHHALQSETE